MARPPSAGADDRPGDPDRPLESGPVEPGPPGFSIRGRGAARNPAGRFERLTYLHEAEAPPSDPAEASSPRTLYLRDPSRSALTFNQSPDIPFEASLNPYRGCEHGCIYCYARPTHEYLGFSAGLDFETKILVKDQLPLLLRKELSAQSWQPRTIAMSGVTDPYQPVERRLRLSRACLEVLTEFRNPVGIVTKNALVVRDIELLSSLAEHRAAAVHISVTTLDANLQRVMEPRTSHPQQRLRAIARLNASGIPVGAMVAPIIPGLNEHEIPAIVEAAAAAGARFASCIVLRLPHGVGDLFADWLERHFPDRRKKVLSKLRAIRGGRLNDPRFGSRMRGEGVFADQIHGLFDLACRRAGLSENRPQLSTAAFRRPRVPQLELFPQ